MHARIVRRLRVAVSVAAAIAAMASFAACGGGGGDGGPVTPTVASVRIAPSSLIIDAGQSAPFTATAVDNAGATVSTGAAVWGSSSPAVASVSSSGLVTGVGEGVATITATMAGRSGSAVVTVRAGVASVAVSPATAQLPLGGAPLQLTAEPRTSTGAPVAGRTPQWASASPAVASVSTTGLVTAVAAGTTTVSATVDGAVGAATIEVLPDPCSLTRAMQLGQSINGQLVAADCRLADNTAIQAYSFTLAARTTVEIVMNSSQVDPYLFLADPQLNVLDQDDDGGPGLNARILRSLPAGEWLVIANTFAENSFGAFQLTVRPAPAACVQAVSLTLPATVNASLSTSSCLQRDASFENRYAFVLTDTATVRIGMSSAQINPFLVVVDDDEQVVAQDDDSGAGTSASIEVLFTPGRYTVLARGAAGEAGSFQLSAARAIDPCAVRDTISVGQSRARTFTATDCATGDGGGPQRFLQRFLLTLPAERALQIDMTSTAVDAYLVLQDAQSGNILAENDDASPGNTNARLSGNFAAGTYVVNTSTYAVGETGPYSLSVQPLQTENVAIAVAPASLSLQGGQTQQLTATVTGSTNSSVSWSSSNANVVTVSPTGLVRAITPGTATITATSQANPARTATAVVNVAQTMATVNVDIAAMYLVQSVQQLDGRVPLVANRRALARVFVRGSRAGLDSVTVRLRVFQGATVLGTFTARAAPTTNVNEACCSANILVPSELMRAGISVLADVDPDNQLGETNEGDNRFPLSGTAQSLQVVDVPPLGVRFVPIAQNRNGQVAGVAVSIFNVFENMWPVNVINADVRQPLVIDYVIGSESFDDWIRLVRDVEIVRQMEGGQTYYYGLVRTTGTRGVLGLANGIPARTAIGIDEGSGFGATFARETFAHEMGHVLSLRHAPCGGATGPDPQYPFGDARTGAWGINLATGQLFAPERKDIMSYCPPDQWVSPFQYRKVLDFRQANPNGAGSVVGPTEVLLVSGALSQGTVTVDPAFSVSASPTADDPTGRFVIEAFDDDGKRLLAHRFTPYAVSDAPDATEAFVVAVPVRPDQQARVARITVRAVNGTSAGIRRRTVSGTESALDRGDIRTLRRAGNRLDASWTTAVVPAVMVRDASSGEVLAVLRRGGMELSQFGALDGLELLVSDGVKSARLRVEPATGALRK